MTEEDIKQLMAEYRDNVRALFDSKSSDFARNSSCRHAAILIEEMILHAKRSFVAFAGRMNPEVWNAAVMAALLDAVNRGVSIKLLVEKECVPIVNGSMPEPIRRFVRRLTSQTCENITGLSDSHCASGDGESLRIELNQAQKSAVFSANNPDVASKIVRVVEGLYGIGVTYGTAA